MSRNKKILVCLGAGCLAVLAYNWCFLFFGDPQEAAHARAHELGWSEEDIVVVGGGYSTELVSWTSSIRFRSESKPDHGEILVEVRKPSPFHGWELARYVHASE